MDDEQTQRTAIADPWCADLIHSIDLCPLCANPARAQLSVKLKPYISCAHCHSRLFLNSRRAAEKLLGGMFLRAVRYHTAVLQEYAAELATTQKILEDEKIPFLSKEYVEKRRQQHRLKQQQLVRSLTAALGRCTLCGFPAEWKDLGKKGHYQACRYCVTTLFVRNALGRAGLVVRNRCLSALQRRPRPSQHG